jgi:hypothetical protein
MKGSRKVTKVRLSPGDQEKPGIYGLVSPDPDYKLSLKLNKDLGILLRNDKPVLINKGAGNEISFSRFTDNSGAPDTLFSLVANRTGTNFLLRQMKNIDFLLLIYDLNDEFPSAGLLTKLRSIDSVTAVFDIDLGTLKDKNLHLLLR